MTESGYLAYLDPYGAGWTWTAFVSEEERRGFEESRERAVAVAVRVLGELKGEK